MIRFSQFLESINRRVGHACSWLTLFMVLLTFVIVVLRYAFDLGWIWLQESVIWMHAAVFMLAAAYTLVDDEHVRVDIFYRNLPARKKAVIDLVGTLVFLIPFTLFLIVKSWNFAAVAWRIREASPDAGGLVFPMVPLMKSFIPLMGLLLLLQGITLLLRATSTLRAKARET